MEDRYVQSQPSGWSSPDSFLTRLFSGDPLMILLSLVITLSLPVLLHFYFYTTASVTSSKIIGPPTFLLLGPSGSGKTSLSTLLQQRSVKQNARKSSTSLEDEKRGRDSDGDDEQENTHPRLEVSPTRMSQTSNKVSLILPAHVMLGSNKYRSENDPALKFQVSTKYQLIDTPGHGKLRSESAMSHLSHQGLKGVIYLVDATALETLDSSLARDTVSYLHDILLALQKRRKGGKKASDIPVLIAANKQDLFTALPAGAIKDKLQAGLENMRTSRRKGISAVDSTDDADEEFDVLGGGGEDKFNFKTMEDEYGIVVDVVGGAARGDEAGKGVQRWEEWIGSCL